MGAIKEAVASTLVKLRLKASTYEAYCLILMDSFREYTLAGWYMSVPVPMYFLIAFHTAYVTPCTYNAITNLILNACSNCEQQVPQQCVSFNGFIL